MNGAFWPTVGEDYRHWQEQDAKTLDKRHTLIEECRRHPFKGTGKPEPLGGNVSGWSSRRIGWEQRLVYRVAGTELDINQWNRVGWLTRHCGLTNESRKILLTRQRCESFL